MYNRNRIDRSVKDRGGYPMEQILDVLYNYIQENRIAYYLNGDPEYCLAGLSLIHI